MTSRDRWFSTPYPPAESALWLPLFLFGEGLSPLHHRLQARKLEEACQREGFVPLRVGGVSSGIAEGAATGAPLDPSWSTVTGRLLFFGDWMPTRGRILTLSDEIAAWHRESSWTFINFEGVIRSGKIRTLLEQHHALCDVEASQKSFRKNRTILNFANNHAGDLGLSAHRETIKRVQDMGFLTIGHHEADPLVLPGGIYVDGASEWNNHPESFALPNVRDVTQRLLRTKDSAPIAFSVLHLHWGYEFRTLPRLSQWHEVSDLLRQWDLVVGHHSHTPQPIFVKGHQAVAFSLGNFGIWVKKPIVNYGTALRVEIAEDNGLHTSGRVSARYDASFIHLGVGRREVLVSPKASVPFIPQAKEDAQGHSTPVLTEGV